RWAYQSLWDCQRFLLFRCIFYNFDCVVIPFHEVTPYLLGPCWRGAEKDECRSKIERSIESKQLQSEGNAPYLPVLVTMDYVCFLSLSRFNHYRLHSINSPNVTWTTNVSPFCCLISDW